MNWIYMFFRNFLFSLFFLFVVNISSAQTKYLKMSPLIKTYNTKDYKKFLKDADAFLIKNPAYNGTELVVLYQMIITASNETKDFEKTLLYIDKILIEFNKNKLDNTWLSKANDFHKDGSKWNKWRNENIDAYNKLQKQIINDNNSSIASDFSNKEQLDTKINNYDKQNTSIGNDFNPSIESFYDRKSDSIFNNYEGLYRLDKNNLKLLKDKNTLLFKTFIDGEPLKSRNNSIYSYYLIFKHKEELLLIELDKNLLSYSTRESTSSLFKYLADYKKIKNLKNDLTSNQRKIYSVFIKNKDKRYWSLKKGNLVLNKKWKKNLQKYNKDLASSINNISINNFKVSYKNKYIFDINQIDENKNDFYRIINLYNRLLSNEDKIDLKLDNFILDIDKVIANMDLNLSNFINTNNTVSKNHFYKINFDTLNQASTYIPNLIKGSVYKFNYQTNIRKLKLDKSNKNLTISVGNKFSFSSIDLVKHERSDSIVELFKSDVIKNAIPAKLFNYSFNKFLLVNNELSQEDNNEYVSKDDYKNESRLISVKSTGQGGTIKEAKENALRNALEETYGIFMSSKTTIKNDDFSDDMQAIVTGSIDSYKLISTTTLPDKTFTVLVEANVSPSKIRSYTRSTGSKIIMDVNSFTRNLKLFETNKSSEEKSIAILCENLNKFIRQSIDFNIVSSEPKYTENDKTKFIMKYKVNWSLNQNFKNFEDNLFQTLSDIGMTNDEVIDYIKIQKPYYKFGNTYLRSLKSKKMIISLLSGLNFYAYNYSIDYGKKSLFPSSLIYSNKLKGYIHTKKNDVKSTPVSIGGLISNNPRNTYQTNNHDIKDQYKIFLSDPTKTDGYTPIDFNVGPIYKKNGDIIVSDNDSKDFMAVYDPSASIYSGKHEFELIISEKDFSKMDGSIILKDNNNSDKTNNFRAYKKKIKNTPLTKEDKDTSKEALIIGNDIWIRSSPNNGEVIAYLNNGKNVLILGKCCKSTINSKTNDWYKIQFNGQTGWVFGSQLKLINNADKSKEITTTYTGLAVTEDDDGWSNVRSGNSTSYSILFKIYAGEKFNILSNDGKWSYIDFNGRRGYIHNSIIRKYTSNQNKKSTSVNNSNSIKKSRNNTSEKLYNSIGSYQSNVTGYYTFDDGNNDDRFENPNSALRYNKIESLSTGLRLFKGMGQFTISFWCETNSFSSGRDYALFSLGSTSSQYFRLSGSRTFYYDNQSLILNTNSPGKYFGYNTTNDTFDAITNSTAWNHYAIVLDNGNFSIYINGSKVGQRKINYSKPYDASIFKMGSNGVVFDDVIFFDNSLSSYDIQELYQNQLYPAN